ncbi:T1SS-143 repeat domain-containing protein, partial [Pacificispira spongiicola]|uniref:T1SS-143 repeat domain-containing protein n=1 Tax=Pacificispira spongiicola TaxID=2729598 RepID=UPI0029CA43EB
MDDVPTAVDDGVVTLEEGGNTVTGNVMTNDTEGADGAEVTSFTYTDENGVEQTGDVGVEVDTQYGTLTVNADGSYTYTSDANEDHTDGNPLTDGFTYTITDGDGDTATATQTFSIEDTGPTIDPPPGTPDPSDPSIGVEAGRVNEDDLTGGSDDTPDSTTVTGSMTVDGGADGIASIAFAGTDTLPTLTSNGAAIAYTLSEDGQTITGSAGSDDIFTMVLTGDGSGYQFDLLGTIDHEEGQGTNEVDLPFTVEVTDGDGTTASTVFHIAVVDDVPTAVDDATVTLEEGNNTVTGNVMTNDTEGADGAEVTSFTYTDENGVEQTGDVGVEVDTQYGTLTVNADGSYTYTSDGAEQHTDGEPLEDAFTYTITDADGDTSSATQAFTITDDGPQPPTYTPPPGGDPPPPGEPPVGEIDPNNPEIGVNAGRVNEDDLTGGSDDTPESTTVSGAIAVDGGADGIASIAFTGTDTLPPLTSNGTSLSYTISEDGQTITGSAGSDDIFTMTLTNGGTGYSFDLLGTIDHPEGQAANEVDLPFTVEVTDGDGSTASSNFHISVVDDVPVAVDDNAGSIDEGQSVSGSVMTNDTEGADGATVTEVSYTDANGQPATAVVDPVNGATVTT